MSKYGVPKLSVYLSFKIKAPLLNLQHFIARRLINAKEHKSSISAPIIKIAIAAVAIGMLMMIVSVSAGMGLQQKIREKVSAFNGHVSIANYDDNQSEVSVNAIDINQSFYPKFKNIAGISHIQAVASKAGIIRTEDAFEGIIFKGVGKDYQWKNIQEYIIQGKKPDLAQELNSEVMISQYLADRLKLKLGDKFNTFFMKDQNNQRPNLRVFTIVGIFNSGLKEFDGTYIIGDIRHVQRINKWKENQIGSFEVFVDDFTKIDQKTEEIYGEIGSTLDTVSITQKYSFIFEWLKLFDFNIILIIGIMILVATINMAVALLVLILERTRMIGILKALGGNNAFVRKIFLYNAFYLIVRGLFWGNFIGITLILIQQYTGVVTLNPENYYVNQAPVIINWWLIGALNLGTLIVCLLVLLVPSYIITKISPVQAIRFS